MADPPDSLIAQFANGASSTRSIASLEVMTPVLQSSRSMPSHHAASPRSGLRLATKAQRGSDKLMTINLHQAFTDLGSLIPGR
jgi:hypothetical protein